MNVRTRSLLFVPAVRPDLVAKLPRSSPDGAILDLEDAVPPAAKADASTSAYGLAEQLAAGSPGMAVYVRINGLATEWFDQDIANLAPSLTGVIVPKIERASDIEQVQAALHRADRGHLDLVIGIESPLGVLHAEEILIPGVSMAYFGAEDFVTSLGGVRTEASLEVLYARSRIALVARVVDIPVIDQVVVAYTDDELFRRDAAMGRSLGYTGKLCISPRQVPLANETFSPSVEEVLRLRRMLSKWEEATSAGEASFAFEGQMVDHPVAMRAQAVLRQLDE